MRLFRYLTEATTGLDSWRKHFAGNSTRTTLNSDSYIYDIEGNKTKDFIPVGSEVVVIDITPEKLKGTLLATVQHKGNTVKIKFNNIAKPLKGGASEKLRINATNLTYGANVETVTLMNKTFEAKVFSSATDLSVIIQNSLDKHDLIPNYLKQNVSQYLQQRTFKTINWDDNVSDSEKNELGKYLGELIIGLMGLNGEISIPGTLSANEVDSFVVPDDPSFSGVDSLFIRKKDGSIVAISSKFGVGAKASFFSNLLPTMVKNRQMVSSRTLKILTDIVIKNSLNPSKQGKEILYTFGINHILGLKINNPMQVYYDIIKGKETEEVKMVLDKIKSKRWNLEGDYNKVIKLLPMSLTSFFSRSISYLLNNDKDAIDDMIKVLGVKDYWQANLDINSWKKGNVKFSFKRSGKAELTIIGSKAAIGDIKGSQGMLNYLLK